MTKNMTNQMRTHTARPAIQNVAVLTLFLAFSLNSAQAVPTNAPPMKLAIVPEENVTPAICDILTVELSADDRLEILERAEIDRVYQEQMLTTTSADHVQLGRILHADGLLLMGLTQEGTNHYLTTRLIAVQPGVIVASLRSPWPVPDAPNWARLVASQFRTRVPKLTINVQDAIPLSFVALRSAIRSADSEAAERDINTLIVDRLSHEPELFVLERRRMDAMEHERALSNTNNPFWNGAYLIDGTLDRDGFDRHTITISARMVHPESNGQETIEISGNRNQLTALADQFAEHVIGKLKLKPRPSTWSPEHEASQYLSEAEWALKWGMWGDARTAADSAWALGERSIHCASVRLKSYISDAVPDTGGYQASTLICDNLSPADAQKSLDKAVRDMFHNNPDRFVYARDDSRIRFLVAAKSPEQVSLKKAQALLQVYESMSKIVAADELAPTDDWYRMGIEALATAASTLKHFCMSHAASDSARDQIAEMRAEARRIANWLSESPAGNDTLWLWGSPTTHSACRGNHFRGVIEFPDAIQSVQWCQLTWGQYWQERPDDFLRLCREMVTNKTTGDFALQFLSSKMFDGLDVDWLLPRLAEQSSVERQRVDKLWDAFIVEMGGRTLRFADDGKQRSAMLNALAKARSRATLASPPAPSHASQQGIPPPIMTNRHSGSAQIGRIPSMPVMRPNERTNQITATLAQRRAMLETTNILNSSQVQSTFLGPFIKYSEAEARELLPLLATYRTNLMMHTGPDGHSPESSTHRDSNLKSLVSMTRLLESRLRYALPPPTFEERMAMLTATNVLYPQQVSDWFLRGEYSELEAQKLLPLLAAYRTNLASLTVANDFHPLLLTRREYEDVALLIRRTESRLHAIRPTATFPEQKAFLASSNPDPLLFASFFEGNDSFTESQAREIGPLLVSYEARLSTLDSTQIQNSFARQYVIPNIKNILTRLDAMLTEAEQEHWPEPLIPNFFPIPTPSLAVIDDVNPSSQWAIRNTMLLNNGHLWLDLRLTRDGIDMMSTNRSLSVFLNPDAKLWSVLAYPPVEQGDSAFKPTTDGGWALNRDFVSSFDGYNLFLDHAAIIGTSLFVSGPGYLRHRALHYDPWQTVSAPWQAAPTLFPIGQRLFAANRDAIYELQNVTDKVWVLASCRRRPAVSELDEYESFDAATLIPGPDNTVRAIVGSNRLSWGIFSWNGTNWQSLHIVPENHSLDGVIRCEDATLLNLSMKDGSSALWSLPHDRDELELCLIVQTPSGYQAGSRELVAPRWKTSLDFRTSQAGAATVSTNLIVLVQAPESNLRSIHNRPIADERNASHAQLLVCEPARRTPIILPLKIVPETTPKGKIASGWGTGDPFRRIHNWITANSDWVLFGQSDVPGAWGIPRKEFDRAIAQEERRLSKAQP